MHPDTVIADIAARQHGVVAASQLLAAGLTRTAIRSRVASAHLHRLHRGVFAVGHVSLPARAAEQAALLACGPHAVLSHRTAAAVWALLPADEGAPVDVSVRRGQARERPGIRVHRPASLDAGEVRRRDGLPVTSPARTLADLAATLELRTLERAVAEAQALRLVRAEHLLPPRGHPGAARLRAVLDAGPRRSRAETERRLLDLVRAARLPAPETNVMVAGFEVDLLWREHRLVVEADGYAFHGSRHAFERDRRKDLALQAAGFRVLRVSWRQLEHEPEAVVAVLAATLARAV